MSDVIKISIGDPHYDLKLEATSVIREHKSYKYRSRGDDEWLFMLGSETLIGFTGEANVREFIDKVDEAVEKHAMQPLRLHLTGCKRCQRTAQGIKNDPCNRGIPIFLSTKSNAERIVRALVAAVQSEG